MAHKTDFGIEAEWHFHATSHGKGACDGIGANIKRQAARFSLQCSRDRRILDPKALYCWANEHCKETKIFFSSKESYNETANILKPRLDNAITIKGTLQYHAFVPSDDGRIILKKFSSSKDFDYFPQAKHNKKKRFVS